MRVHVHALACLRAGFAQQWCKMSNEASSTAQDRHCDQRSGDMMELGQAPCVHFKDTNSVLTGGDAWAIPHGRTVLLEACPEDHSNEVRVRVCGSARACVCVVVCVFVWGGEGGRGGGGVFVDAFIHTPFRGVCSL
jgi:hypothetical protein